MSRLVASGHGLRAILALDQRPAGLRRAELAATLGVPFSSAQRALDLLLADGLVELRGRRFLLVSAARGRTAVRFALAMLDPIEAVAVLAAANRSVEFAGVDGEGVLLVTRRFAEPVDEALLARALGELGELHDDLHLEVVAKADLRERLLDDSSPRVRAGAMRVLAGSVERSFPDRMRHGDEAAPRLGRLHPDLAPPSGRRLRALARRHGLRRVVAFGSATRADFRTDSDLDLLVEAVSGHRLGLRQRAALLADAEDLFRRDVDLVAAGEADAALAERIEREGVVLVGPSA